MNNTFICIHTVHNYCCTIPISADLLKKIRLIWQFLLTLELKKIWLNISWHYFIGILDKDIHRNTAQNTKNIMGQLILQE